MNVYMRQFNHLKHYCLLRISLPISLPILLTNTQYVIWLRISV